MPDRKTFILQLAGGGLGLMLGGCGGGGGEDPPVVAAAACGRFDFSANHGHALSLSAADLDSTVARTFSVQGSAPHSHQVTLSPAQLAALKAGLSVVVATSVDATHSHDVSGSCR